ncbi:hypothetical protein [Neobacillus cucumis]|uniref:Uncharacterized protein n=1 Tax=Neobacillus cucumis TaxID=1740721 RepID=A0A2N5H8V9_9BACI|nr:hypothetical protein [Neobacillus cucumis]PLS01935.1 hypothetical protein CVD27_22730 [Neobacillus cucumis]
MPNGSHRFSGENQEINDLALMFQINYQAVSDYKSKIIKQIREGHEVPEEFLFMTFDEVEIQFTKLLREIENSFCLNLIASIEARFRMDYIVRATDRLRDQLSREFRNIYREYEEKVGLEELILEKWKIHYPEIKSYISAYIGALKYRHWLAHGRYWKPKLGRNYDAISVFPICEGVIENVSFCV